MAAIILIFGCLLMGVLLQFLPSFPAHGHKGLVAFLIHVSLPAVTLRYLPELSLSWELLFPAGMAWIGFLAGALVFSLLGKWMRWPAKTIGCLILVAGLGNTSFVGFPLIEALYGTEGLRYAVLCDQPGSFLVLSTLGIAAMGYFLTGSWKVSSIGKELFRFPPFLAFLLALVLLLSGVGIADVLKTPLEVLGATLSPIALVAIGLQLQNPFTHSSEWSPLRWGLFHKLALAPALILLLYLYVADLPPIVANVSILEAAMPPMVTPAIIAMDKDLNPSLASLLIAIGIPIGIGTVFGWHAFLSILN